jgi:hypothetical protein
MDYNIISRYLKQLKIEFLDFFRIVFDNVYPKKICGEFLDRYFDVRYNNETNYPREKDFVTRVNKELVLLYKTLRTDELDDTLRNIVALFGYIIYFDDIDAFAEEGELINSLVEDENITISHSENLKKDLTTWYVNLKKMKETFNSSIFSKEFSLIEKRLYRNTFKLDLVHNVKISNLYSEFAINKVYNSGTVYEQRLFITYIMASYLVLDNARNLDFSKNYVVPFSEALLGKEKKLKRLLNTFNNVLAKKKLTIMIEYKDYVNSKKIIDEYINMGYSFGVVLDDKFNGDINKLVLFSYVFMYEDYPSYDKIISKKDMIKSKIITL